MSTKVIYTILPRRVGVGGRMAEVEVLVLFVLLAILWISRDPKESPGWASLFMKGYDGTSGGSKATLSTHYSAEHTQFFFPLSVCVPVCLCLSVCLSACPFVSSLCLTLLARISVGLSPTYLSLCLCLCLCLSVCLSVSLSVSFFVFLMSKLNLFLVCSNVS